jgi:PAS domain S-box-containing protein
VNRVWRYATTLAKIYGFALFLEGDHDPLSSLRILLVDDQEAFRRGLRSLLASRPDWSICGEAEDGADAVAKAKALRPDVVLMDVSMPRMNGLEATRIIRRELPKAKVVIVSQNDPTLVRRQARDVDIAAFVDKADVSRTLLPTIEGVVGHRDTGMTSKEGREEHALETRLPASDFLNLDSKPYLIELLPFAAYAVRAPDGVIVWFNTRATQLWGRTPMIGDPDEKFCGAHKLFQPDGTYLAHCDTPVALALKTGAPTHGQEVVIEKPGGSRVNVLVHIEPIRESNGSIAGVVNFFQDITDRKRLERAQGLLASIVDSSEDAVVSKNLDGTITSWNKSAERLFGYPAEEAIGQHITLIVPHDRRNEETMILEKIRRGERLEHFETLRVRKDGTLVNISVTISPVKDAAGNVVGASKVARDITERRMVEQELAERALLLDLSNDAIFVRDPADRVTYWNDSASELYGYSRAEAMGQVTHDLLHTEFPESLERITEQLQRDGHWTGELIHRRKDGSQIVVVSRWALERDNRGNPKCVLETNNDITQQKRSEKALRESENRLRALTDTLEMQVRIRTEQLEQRNSEVLKQSEQLRDLSRHLLQLQDEERRHIARELHDSAGQTLTALGMNLATVVQHSKNSSPQLASIAAEGQELVRELSREIRTTSYLLHPPLLDESGLSEALSYYVEGLKGRSGLKIKQAIAADFGRLSLELELAIFRIVQECLTNVHRHSGSKVAAIRMKRDERSIFLEVEDEGGGISPEKLLEIQSNRAGVGIRGIRERVLQFGGKMEIESKGRGTRILITLPFARKAVSKAEESHQRAKAAV